MTPPPPPAGAAGPASVPVSHLDRPRARVEEPPLLLYVIKQLELLSRVRLAEVLRPAGVTVQQYTALTVLERRGDLSSAALARSAFVTAQSMAEIVSALESRRLIERHRDPSNRRQLLIRLTPAGHKLIQDFAAPVGRLEQQMVSALTAHQVASLRGYLDSCRSSLAAH